MGAKLRFFTLFFRFTSFEIESASVFVDKNDDKLQKNDPIFVVSVLFL